MGAVLALTTAAELPERVRRVIAVNAYDYRDGIARSGTLARMVIGGALIPGVGQVVARMENHAVLSRILQSGLIDRTALRPDYVDELLRSGSRPGYPAVARAVYRNMPSLIAARSRYPDVKAPVREAAEHTVDLWSTSIVFRAGTGYGSRSPPATSRAGTAISTPVSRRRAGPWPEWPGSRSSTTPPGRPASSCPWSRPGRKRMGDQV